MEGLIDLGISYLTNAIHSDMFKMSVIQNDVLKMTFAFLVAARLHRRWVKKDLTEQFGILTEAINNVSSSVAEGLSSHAKRIDDLTSRVNTIEANTNLKENIYERL